MSDSSDLSSTPATPPGPGVAQAAAVSAAAADATGPDAAGPYAPKDEAPKDAEKTDAAPKPPARPAAEIRADIVKERVALGASFDALRADVDDAVDSGRQRAADLGRKAKIVAPLVGAGLAVALFLRSRARAKR
jgi:hypothetical protein